MTNHNEKEFHALKANFAKHGYELTVNHENQLVVTDQNPPNHQRFYETLHDALSFISRLGLK